MRSGALLPLVSRIADGVPSGHPPIHAVPHDRLEHGLAVNKALDHLEGINDLSVTQEVEGERWRRRGVWQFILYNCMKAKKVECVLNLFPGQLMVY